MGLRFLQISDLHFQFINYQTQVMRDQLLEFIRKLRSNGDFDFLLLTGDMTHQGKTNTEELKDYLTDIMDCMGIQKENVHMIPGNHDIKRDDLRTLAIEGITSSPNPSSRLEELSNPVYETLLEGQRDFMKFYEEFLGKEYPKEELHFAYQSEKYNILLMNTCLISCKKGEEGNLLINQTKFYNAIKKIKEYDSDRKLNLAIGHHTLECIHDTERDSIRAHFDDFLIDMYLSGHVHSPAYNITANTGENNFYELVSGAIVSDGYTNPTFIMVDVDLESGNTEGTFYMWNKDHKYWAENNQLGRRVKDGKMNFNISRLKKKENEPEEFEEINEDEFKQFIIDFHEKHEVYKNYESNLDNKIDLKEKFYLMRSGETFKRKFDGNSKYFGVINHIMNSTSYVISEKKELIAETIVDKYLENHYKYDNGDEIFVKIVNDIHEEIKDLFPYSNAVIKKYVKILTCWCIHECEIFNDNKRDVVY